MKKVIFTLGLGILAVIFVFLSPRGAFGAIFCVDNAAALQTALDTAGVNNQPDTIRVVQGTYTDNFTYIAGPIEDYSLTLEGGYTAGCASRVVDPINTILNGDESGRVLSFTAAVGNTGASLNVDGFAIAEGDIGSDGGGIFADLPGSITITNNLIDDNYSGGSGGGVFANSSGGTITLTNNTISGNTATDEGGGVYATTSGGTITLTNNIISENIVNNDDGGGVFANSSGGTITLTNNTISGNFSSEDGGGVSAYGGTITLTNNTINGNKSEYNGAGVSAYTSGGTINFTNNTISGNTIVGDGRGGGVYAGTSGGTITFTNNTISGNTAEKDSGGGVWANIFGGTITLTNNTISENTSVFEDGGGLYLFLGTAGSTANVYNNIIYDNTAGFFGNDIYFNNSGQGSANMCYNDFSDLDGEPLDNTGTGCGVPNNGNIDADPSFVDAVGEDFHLLGGSSAIDVGYNSAPSIPATDKDGIPRIINGVVDMGAYEYCGCPLGSKLGCISGTVEEAGTGEPVAQKRVLLFKRKNKRKFYKRTKTNENGCYTFDKLRNGSYTVYVGPSCRNVVSGKRRHYVRIRGGGKLDNVNFECN